ncbi:hypothetical protein [Nonomuraea sp. SYSU D8015]|uniref:hypothetical protein n=1 Tax=Nonomuraea sp. SYSU D8015 TaxID=2593644 RepID=UPI0016603B72|nr:hypothetical protein [Nonomuraea sp. SYSU D8015]
MTAAPDAPPALSDVAARRFPLIARTQVIGRPLPVRAEQIRARAGQAASGGPDALLRACEALNLAALVASDCGMPDLARAWCWEQFDLLHQARPHPLATAKLALQPVINLARLHIRDGDGGTAWQLLHGLFTAVHEQAAADLDGRTVALDGLTRADDVRELCAWLWEVLLADGLRALARAGRWEQALVQAEQLRGIGTRLGDGRQIAILARCLTGRPDKALHVLQDSDVAEPWEEAVSSCLTVFCLRAAGKPAQAAAQRMAGRYLDIGHEPALAAFTTRLGLVVMDLLDDDRAQAAVHERLVALSVSPGGSYAARDVLGHSAAAALLTDRQAADLARVVEASGLGQGHTPTDVYDAVAESMRAAAAALHTHGRAAAGARMRP